MQRRINGGVPAEDGPLLVYDEWGIGRRLVHAVVPPLCEPEDSRSDFGGEVTCRAPELPAIM